MNLNNKKADPDRMLGKKEEPPNSGLSFANYVPAEVKRGLILISLLSRGWPK